MAASLFAGASVNPAMLIGSRLVQCLSAAMVLPSTLSTLNAMFQGRERGIAFAIWGSTIGGMAAVGPLVGGWLATDVSWRWAFWLNIPFGLLALVGGVALVAAFVVVEQRRVLAGRVALVDLGLLRIRSFRFGIVAALIVALGEFGLLFTLPLLLQGALGYSALGTGFLVLWLAVGTFLVSGATPQLTARIGQRSVVRVGLGLETVAIAGLAVTLSTTVPGVVIAVWLFVHGVGVGMATAQLTSVILVEVPVAESGQASGFQTTVRQLGSALGVALLGGLLVSNVT